MPTLYRNYTVVVQDSDSPYAPKNDLELLLYEGRVEIKINPATASNAVFQYGTTTLAVQVLDEDGAGVSATVTSATLQPGEYEFQSLDLNATTSGNLGNTLYSVVARPSADSALNSFERAGIIVDRTDVSDPNVKQLVKASIGGASSIADNIAFAGGTVLFEQYSGSGLSSTASCQYLSLTSLPATVAGLIETVSAVPVYGSDDKEKLIARFNVFYSNADGTEHFVWNGVPAYKTADDAWVIRLQADEYSIDRSSEFGTDPGEIDLGGIYLEFAIAVGYGENNIHVRNFDNTPATTIPTVNSPKERVCLHSFIDGSGNRIVGVGAWTYADAANTPSYNLDIKCTVGVRAQLSSRTVLELSTTSYRFGYDTTQTFFGASLTSVFAQLSSKYKFLASSVSTSVGFNVTTYPRLTATATQTRIASSLYTYLYADTSNSIVAQVKTGSSVSLRRLDLNAASQKIGYQVDGGLNIYWGTTASNMTAVFGGKTKFKGSATAVDIGHDALVAYPIMKAASTYVRMMTSATTYWEATNANEQLRAYANSKNVIDLYGSGIVPYAKFGYDIGTSFWTHFNAGGAFIYGPSSSQKFYTTTLATAMGDNLTGSVTPYIVGTSTYIQIQGTGSSGKTYLRVNTANQILGYMEVSSIARKVLSADAASTTVKIGYNIDGAVTPLTVDADSYFYASNASIGGYLGSVPKFFSNISSVNIGMNAFSFSTPVLVMTDTLSSMYGSATTYRSISASADQTVISGILKSYISTTGVRLYGSALTTYFETTSTTIRGYSISNVAFTFGDGEHRISFKDDGFFVMNDRYFWLTSRFNNQRSMVYGTTTGSVLIEARKATTSGSIHISTKDDASGTVISKIQLEDNYINIYKRSSAAAGDNTYTIFSTYSEATDSNVWDSNVISMGKITDGGGIPTMFLKLPYMPNVSVLPAGTGAGIGTMVFGKVSGAEYFLSLKYNAPGGSGWFHINLDALCAGVYGIKT